VRINILAENQRVALILDRNGNSHEALAPVVARTTAGRLGP